MPVTGVVENMYCITKSFTPWYLCQKLTMVLKPWKMRWTGHMLDERNEKCTQNFWQKDRDSFTDLGFIGRIILKWIL